MGRNAKFKTKRISIQLLMFNTINKAYLYTQGKQLRDQPSMDIIQEAIDYYKANRQDFITQYANQYLLIRGTEIIGVFPTNGKATEAGHSLVAGTYIIEHPRLLKK
jgi:hypothetical protein